MYIIFTVVSFCIAYTLCGFTDISIGLGLCGVACIAVGYGLGEAAILSYLSMFDDKCLVAFTSGTGLSGLSASLLYLLLATVLKIK